MAIQYNSNYDITIPFSDVCAQFNLAIGVEDTFTVPGNPTQNFSARFSYTSTSNVFVRLNGTPVVPASSVVGSQQYGEFRPGDDGSQRYVKGGDVLHFITPDASAYCGISIRALNT